MPHPCPHHCPPERGRGLAVAAVVAVVVIASAAARPVVHAAETVLEVAAITAGAVLGLAAVAVVAIVVTRARRGQRQAYTLTGRVVRQLPASQGLAIDPPRPVYGPTYEHPEHQQRPHQERRPS
jgi:hypothetical protein